MPSIFKDLLLHLIHFSLPEKIVNFHPCAMIVINIVKLVPILLQQTRLFCLIWITAYYTPFSVPFSYQTKCCKHVIRNKARCSLWKTVPNFQRCPPSPSCKRRNFTLSFSCFLFQRHFFVNIKHYVNSFNRFTHIRYLLCDLLLTISTIFFISSSG